LLGQSGRLDQPGLNDLLDTVPDEEWQDVSSPVVRTAAAVASG
jgi:hypothetical protein